MKTKNLVLLGLAAVGGYFLWKKMGTGTTTDPLYAEYLAYRKSFGIDDLPAGSAIPQVYILKFEEWKQMKKSSDVVRTVSAALPNRIVEAVLQNGTIVAGVGEILPPSPMEMAWQYPGLQSCHAPGRIYKV